MGASLAVLGVYKKSSPKNKVYYVNRARFGFSYHKVDENGKKMQRTNLATGMPILNSRGEPEFFEETILFKQWHERFSEYGYWSVYEVTESTPKAIAEAIAAAAKSKDSEVIDEKAFIKLTNPVYADHLDESEKLAAEREQLKKENEELRLQKSKAEEEIAKIKQRNGIR